MGARVLFSKKEKNGVIVEETHIDQDVDGRYSDDDDVFVQDPYLDLSSASKPLMHPRQRAKVKSRNPVCKCNRFLKPVLSFVFLVAVLCSLMLLILYLLNKQNHQSKPPLQSSPKAAAALKPKATEHLIGCDQIEVEDVWVKGFPKLLTESAFRLVDVNQDGVKDVIFGFATGADGFNAPEVVCDIYFSGVRPCLGGVLALEGGSGKELWRHYTPHEVFALTCASDINGDGILDCVAAGRMATLEAVSGRDGKLLWTFGEQPAKVATSNVYTASLIRDLDRDGVLDFIISHGGDPFKKPGSKTRLTGRLLLVSGRTGMVIRWMEVPDKGETYYSTQLFLHPGATPMVLFGTGGETHPGSLWSIPFEDLIRGKIEKSIRVYRDDHKGVMTPPVLLDLTRDGVEDIVIFPFNSSVLAFDGLNYTLLWNYTAPLSESYSTPAPGFFNEDDVPDFFVSYSEGPGFPLYFDSKKTVLDGRTGLPLLTSPLQDAVGAQSSPLTISVEGTGNDVFLYWLADCEDHEGQAQQYAFAKGTNVHEQSRTDFCRERFKANMYTRLMALGRNIPVPGVPVYNSRARKAVENSAWVNTTQEADEFLKKHPEHLERFQAYVYRAQHPESAEDPTQTSDEESEFAASEDFPDATYPQQFHSAGSKKGPNPAWTSRDQNRYPNVPRQQSPLPDRSRGRSRYRPQGSYPSRQPYRGEAYDREGYGSPYNTGSAAQAIPPYYDREGDDYDDEGYDRRYPPYRYSSSGDLYNRNGGRRRLKRGSDATSGGAGRGNEEMFSDWFEKMGKWRENDVISNVEKSDVNDDDDTQIYDVINKGWRRRRAIRDVRTSRHDDVKREVGEFFSQSRLDDVRAKLERELERRNRKEPPPEEMEFMKRKRKRRHVGPHDNDGLQRLVSTGTLAPTSLPVTHADYNHSIEVVFATYWFFPAKTSVLLPEDQACIEQLMANESQRFDPNNPHYGEDHDAWEHFVTTECLKKNHPSNKDDRVYESQTTYNPYRVHMGQMTVYRLRITCKCSSMKQPQEDGRRCSRLLPLDQQQWAAYMGSRGDSHWLPRGHV